ncbi:helix-turn-helix domain-containing protein [Flavobacteriaceae bacterium LMO-SS05]
MNDNSYINWVSMNDKALSEAIGKFIQHHRLNQNKSQDALSKAAGISRSTLSLLERGEKVTLNTLIQVLRVLDLLYIMDVFKINEEISPLEYAKLKKNKRKKASGKPTDITKTDNLGW